MACIFAMVRQFVAALCLGADPLRADGRAESVGLILGTLRLEQGRLVAEVNSARRAARLKREIAKRLGKAKINIEYAYLATRPGEKKGLLVLRTDDTKKTAKLLRKR